MSKSITSLRQLAVALGVAVSTCSGYLKREDWPVARKGPWTAAQVDQVKAWRSQLQEDRSGKAAGAEGGDGVTVSAKTKADTALKIHRARQAKVAADMAEGKVIPRPLLEQALASLATMFVQIGDDVFESLPHKLDGDVAINEPHCRQAWHDWRKKIIEHVELDLSKIDDRIAQVMAKRGSKS